MSRNPIFDLMKRYKTLCKSLVCRSHLTFWVNFYYKKCDLYSNIYGNFEKNMLENARSKKRPKNVLENARSKRNMLDFNFEKNMLKKLLNIF